MSIEARKTSGRVRYDVRLRDPAGKPYKRTFRTKREAEIFEARELADRSRGAWVDPRKADTTFGEVATYWLGSNPGKRPSGLARDESIVRVHLLPALEDRPIGAVTPRDVQGFVLAWSAKAAPRTVHRQYGVLRAILNTAVNLDLIARTPCRGVKLPAIEQRQSRIVTGDDLVRLGDALGPALAPMVYLAAVLGLRWGECAGLRVGRMDFLRSTLSVAEQRTRGRAGEMVEGFPEVPGGQADTERSPTADGDARRTPGRAWGDGGRCRRDRLRRPSWKPPGLLDLAPPLVAAGLPGRGTGRAALS